MATTSIPSVLKFLFLSSARRLSRVSKFIDHGATFSIPPPSWFPPWSILAVIRETLTRNSGYHQQQHVFNQPRIVYSFSILLYLRVNLLNPLLFPIFYTLSKIPFPPQRAKVQFHLNIVKDTHFFPPPNECSI